MADVLKLPGAPETLLDALGTGRAGEIARQ